MATLKKLTANLWFAHEAEEAARYYTSIFKNSRIGRISYYGEEGKDIHRMAPGSVMTIEFEIEGQPFMGLNGGPVFKFNESVSFVINCETQEEIDYYWEKLGAGGDPKSQQCGWIKDKFGLSWQVVPSKMGEWMTDPDSKKRGRVMNAMLKMKKLDLGELEKAAK